jgi:hypothetical protein
VRDIPPWYNSELLLSGLAQVQTGGGVEALDFHDAGGFHVVIDGSESVIFAKAVAVHSYQGEPIELRKWLDATILRH